MNKTTPAPAFTSAVTPEIMEAIKQRQQIQAWMKDAAAKEFELRTKIARFFFPSPREGSNTFKEPGIVAKLTHTISRKLIVDTLDKVMPEMDEEHRRLGALITYTPEFSLAWYRALPEDQRRIFDQTLEIKDGSPQLEIVLEEVPSAVTANTTSEAPTVDTAPKKRARKSKASPTN